MTELIDYEGLDMTGRANTEFFTIEFSSKLRRRIFH